jgi:hypothetical protein
MTAKLLCQSRPDWDEDMLCYDMIILSASLPDDE